MDKKNRTLASILAAAVMVFAGAKAAKAQEAEAINDSKIVDRTVRHISETGRTVEIAVTEDGRRYTRTVKEIGNNQYAPAGRWHEKPTQTVRPMVPAQNVAGNASAIQPMPGPVPSTQGGQRPEEMINGSRVVNKSITYIEESGNTVEVAETENGERFSRSVRKVGANQFEATGAWRQVPRQQQTRTVQALNNAADPQTKLLYDQLDGSMQVGEECPVNAQDMPGIARLRKQTFGFQKVSHSGDIVGYVVKTTDGYKDYASRVEDSWLRDCTSNASTGNMIRHMTSKLKNGDEIYVSENGGMSASLATKAPFGIVWAKSNGEVTTLLDFKGQYHELSGNIPQIGTLALNNATAQQYLGNCDKMMSAGQMTFVWEETPGRVAKIEKITKGNTGTETALKLSYPNGNEMILGKTVGKDGKPEFKVESTRGAANPGPYYGR